MKKLLSITIIYIFFSSLVNADFLRIEGAIGAWGINPKGTIRNTEGIRFDVLNQENLESSTSLYTWVNFKHPVPIMPNIRFEYVDPTSVGDGARFEWKDITYNANVNNKLSITQYGATLYYNLLDNTFWTTLDLGVNVKFIETSFELNDSSGILPDTAEEDSFVMPLAYIRTRVEIPTTNIGIEGIARGMAYSENSIIDAQIKVDYSMDFIPIIQPGLEFGYRYQKMKLERGSNDVNATFSGVYGGMTFRF
ncbi:MAG: TIGR04219 family outer membrane beta-barrel protein [Methylococcales bacterium]|nr:TIGR04219 family outer membrane beta-barrel protein [Methylococcales bacterium]